MDSKKRYINIRIWQAEWYMKLNDKQKLFWNFLNDHCNNIGLWETNLTLASLHLGGTIDTEFVDSFFKIVNSKHVQIIVLNDHWFLQDFVKFQYCGPKPLRTNCPPHKSYLNLMVSCNMLEWFLENQPGVVPVDFLRDLETSSEATSSDDVSKGTDTVQLGYEKGTNILQIGYRKGTPTHKDKDKEKESDKEEEKETVKEIDTDIEIDNPLTIDGIVTETLSIFPNKKGDIQFDEHVKCSKIIEHYLVIGDTLENIRIHLKENFFKCKERKLSLNDSLDYIHSSLEVQNEKAVG